MSFKLVSTSPSFGYYAMEPVEYLKQHGCEVELVPQGKKLSEDDLVNLPNNLKILHHKYLFLLISQLLLLVHSSFYC